MTPRQRQFAAAAAAVVALITGATLALWQRTGTAAPGVATVYTQPRPLPEFALLNEKGEPISAAALEGGWSWLFFGFTHCPDVCPTTLATLARARALLNASAPRPAVYLVSVDPERDTPAALRTYVAHFDPEFHAITGTRAQIDKFAAALYVAHGKVPQGDSYTVDHFSGVFFVDDQARVVAVSTSPHDAAALAADYRALRKAAK